MDPTPATTLPDHDRRMDAAESVARWYLGDRGWAGKLVGAYLNPDAALEALELEQQPEREQQLEKKPS